MPGISSTVSRVATYPSNAIDDASRKTIAAVKVTREVDP